MLRYGGRATLRRDGVHHDQKTWVALGPPLFATNFPLDLTHTCTVRRARFPPPIAWQAYAGRGRRGVGRGPLSARASREQKQQAKAASRWGAIRCKERECDSRSVPDGGGAHLNRGTAIPASRVSCSKLADPEGLVSLASPALHVQHRMQMAGWWRSASEPGSGT